MQQHPDHPGLRPENHEDTSPATDSYNCVAWALGEDHRWWEPDPQYLYFWPDDIPRRRSLKHYLAVFRTEGYAECLEPDLRPGEEKVAIFALEGVFKHACRQLANGQWTSKMGSNVDICHELEAVAGGRYGTLHTVFSRPRRR